MKTTFIYPQVSRTRLQSRIEPDKVHGATLDSCFCKCLASSFLSYSYSVYVGVAIKAQLKVIFSCKFLSCLISFVCHWYLLFHCSQFVGVQRHLIIFQGNIYFLSVVYTVQLQCISRQDINERGLVVLFLYGFLYTIVGCVCGVSMKGGWQ